MIDLDKIVARVAQGEGVEAILADMGIDSDKGCQWLKDHPEAKGRIEAAKTQYLVSKVAEVPENAASNTTVH